MPCRNEVKKHPTTMEELKIDFICELQQSHMHQADEGRLAAYKDLKRKSEQNPELECTSLEMKSRLHESCGQLKESVTRVSGLHERMRQLEFQAAREKQQTLKEAGETSGANRRQARSSQ